MKKLSPEEKSLYHLTTQVNLVWWETLKVVISPLMDISDIKLYLNRHKKYGTLFAMECLNSGNDIHSHYVLRLHSSLVWIFHKIVSILLFTLTLNLQSDQIKTLLHFCIHSWTVRTYKSRVLCFAAYPLCYEEKLKV